MLTVVIEYTLKAVLVSVPFKVVELRYHIAQTELFSPNLL